MRRHPGVIAAAAAAVTLAAAVPACGGSDKSGVPSDDTRPTNPAALPPEFLECLADEGFDVEPDEVHSVPQQVLKTCFGSLHGGGAP
ncbi:MAG: hypothetical protein ACRD0W_01860 [Acidimicrobiales bacterium]